MHMKMNICFTLFFLLSAVAGYSQTAKDILDETASRLKKSGGIQATFEATSFLGTTEKGSTNGTICVKGSKFKVNTSDACIWFDGKKQWSLYANSDEVNVSTPTPEEIQSINPYTFIELYKQGYDLSLKEVAYRNESCYEITLSAQDQHAKLREMKVIVDKHKFYPRSVRLKQGNDWFRVRILNLKTNQKWSDKYFEFDQKEYPNIDVIDLR